MPANDPEISVVLAVPGDPARIARTVQALANQTVADRLELILVTETSIDGAAVARLCRLVSHKLVRVPVLVSRAAANATGFAHASADIVAFAEDHCFPAPTWAAALLSRYAEDWDAVGPALENGNPASTVSWADFLLNYSDWADCSKRVAEPALVLPGHNTSYRRTVLERHRARLEDVLEVETELHAHIRESGGRLCFEPAARVTHVNISKLRPWLSACLHAGRIYAAARSREWSSMRRAFYALSFPLIVVWRLLRELRGWPMNGVSKMRVAPILFAGLTFDAVGQSLGYSLGPGNARNRMARYELFRSEHVRESERTLLFCDAVGESQA